MAVIGRVRTGEGDRVAIELTRWTLVWAAGLFALFVLFTTLRTVFHLATPLPYLDQWDIVREVQRWHEGTSDWAMWWSQHDEHRPLVPRTFWYADFWLFSGKNISVYVEIVVLQAATAAMLAFAVWRLVRDRPDRLFTGSLMLAVIVALCFSLVQVENFIHAFQLYSVLGTAAALGAFALAARASKASGRAAAALLAGAVLLCTVSQLSFASGMFSWAVLVGLCWRLGFERRLLVAIGAIGIALTVLYYANYVAVPNQSPADALEHPVRLVIFWFRLIGSPFLPVMGEGWATILGAAALVGFTRLLVRTLRAPPGEVRPAIAFLVAIMAFVVISTASIAWARSALGLYWAESPRFAQGPVLFWVAFFIVGWLSLERQWHPFWWQAGGLGAALSLTLIPALTPDQSVPPWQDLFDSFEQTEDSMYTGVLDRDILARVFPYERTPELAPLIAMLEEERYSIFASRDGQNAVGLELDDIAPGRSDRCDGVFDATLPVKNIGDPGSLVVGWAWDPLRAERPEMIVIVDASGTIVGQARTRVSRTDVRIALATPTDLVGWAGYSLATVVPARALAILGDGPACLLTGRFTVPSAVVPVP